MNSSKSNEGIVNNDDNVQLDETSIEFTLEDTLGYFKDIEKDRHTEVEELTEKLRNNAVHPLKRSDSPSELEKMRQRYVVALEQLIAKDESVDFLAPATSSLHLQVVDYLETEITGMSKVIQNTKEEMIEIKKDIAYLEEKHSNLEKMKEAALVTNNVINSSTVAEENRMVKNYFKIVKQDLEVIVDTFFPNNTVCQELLVELTRALTKGGDDVYIDITPQTFDFVNFLVEADIAVYHPHDRNKIRVVNLL